MSSRTAAFSWITGDGWRDGDQAKLAPLRRVGP